MIITSKRYLNSLKFLCAKGRGILPVVTSPLYTALDKKGRFNALHMLEHLYYEDRKDGGNRQEVFLQAADQLSRDAGIEAAKAFLTNEKRNTERAFGAIDSPGTTFF